MENCSNEMLNRAMRNAGIRNGFEDITAEFAAFRDFKLKWTRSYKWISFEVSDYLRNAPEHVIQSLAETVFARIRGDNGAAYSEEVCDYLNSQEFLDGNQKQYLKRFRGISDSPKGESVDLLDCYRRLAEQELVEYDPRLVFRWGSSEDRSRKVGRSSVLMRTIVMNPALDSEDVPEEFIEKVSRLINEEKSTVIVDHIEYDMTEGRFDNSIFTMNRPEGDFDKAYAAKKNIQDYIFTDSQVERRFAEDLDGAEEVIVYSKLPDGKGGFYIPTPWGNTLPTGR